MEQHRQADEELFSSVRQMLSRHEGGPEAGTGRAYRGPRGYWNWPYGLMITDFRLITALNNGVVLEIGVPAVSWLFAYEIRKDWHPVHYSAAPYLDAMLDLERIEDNYFADSAREVVARFLGNATSWRGETARRVKKELKGLLK